MNWNLTVYRRDGSEMVTMLYSQRNHAREVMRDMKDLVEETGSYWIGSPDSLYLIRFDDFGGVEIRKAGD